VVGGGAAVGGGVAVFAGSSGSQPASRAVAVMAMNEARGDRAWGRMTPYITITLR